MKKSTTNCKLANRYILELRIYATFAVVMCGIFGLSIANAVFVDTLVADNSDDIEQKMDKLYDEFRELRSETRRLQSKE